MLKQGKSLFQTVATKHLTKISGKDLPSMEINHEKQPQNKTTQTYMDKVK